MEYSIYCYNSIEAPTSLKLQYSDNGTDWVTVDTRPDLVWAGGETKVFSVTYSS